MAYCTESKVSSRAISIAEIPINRIADGLEFASAYIDGILGSRYSVPFSPVPVQIREISADLAAYKCLHAEYMSGGQEKVLAGADELFRMAKEALQMLAEGKMVLTYEVAPSSVSEFPGSTGHPSNEPSFPASFDMVNVPCNNYVPFAQRRVGGFFYD